MLFNAFSSIVQIFCRVKLLFLTKLVCYGIDLSICPCKFPNTFSVFVPGSENVSGYLGTSVHLLVSLVFLCLLGTAIHALSIYVS